MKAIALNSFGGPEVLQIRDVPTPQPEAGEVLIEVAYAGINPADWKDREGSTRAFMSAQFPYVIGFDGAGVVSAVGAEVSQFAPGDRVFTCSNHGKGKWGSYAQYMVATQDAVAHVPDAIDLSIAAAIPVAGLTAWQGLFAADKGALPKANAEKKILVNGGAGGLGTFAIQFAKWAGCAVATTCSTNNLDYVQALGADYAIDYTAQDVLTKIREWTEDENGVDLILDTVGATSIPNALDMLKPGGTLMSVPTLQNDGDIETETIEAQRQGKRKIYGFMSDTNVQSELSEIIGLIENGSIIAPPVELFALNDAASAHKKIQTGHVRGKLLLKI